MNWYKNLRIGGKLITGFLVVAMIIAGVATLGYINLKSVNDGMATMYTDRLLPIQQLGNTEVALYTIRGNVYKCLLIPEERAKIEQDTTKQVSIVNEQIKMYRDRYLTQEEKDHLAKFDKGWTDYQEAIAHLAQLAKEGKPQEAIQGLADGGSAL